MNIRLDEKVAESVSGNTVKRPRPEKPCVGSSMEFSTLQACPLSTGDPQVERRFLPGYLLPRSAHMAGGARTRTKAEQVARDGFHEKPKRSPDITLSHLATQFFSHLPRQTTLRTQYFSTARQSRRPVFFTREAFRQLLTAIPNQWFRELVIFAVSSMMRVSEIVNLTWASVDLKRRVIMVENTREFRLKTTQPHGMPMNDWAFAFLASREQESGNIFRFPDERNLNVH